MAQFLSVVASWAPPNDDREWMEQKVSTVVLIASIAWAERRTPAAWLRLDQAAPRPSSPDMDYLGAAPVRGTRFGGGEALDVAVQVSEVGGQRQSWS